jgi:hypothetical protein
MPWIVAISIMSSRKNVDSNQKTDQWAGFSLAMLR